MARFINRVTVLDLSAKSGGTATTLLKGKKRRKKRVTKFLRPTERVIRQYLKAERKCWSNMTRLHNKSRTKKNNRWLTDSLSNSLRSMDKGCRVFSNL